LPKDYKGVDEDGADGVDKEVHPVEEMAMKILMATATGSGGGCPRGQRPLPLLLP
jgi:hypothetical protein